MSLTYGTHEVRIYYEDTDHSGVVYHANYIKYYERAREHLLGPEKLVALWEDQGVGFVVTKVELNYKLGARFGDVLEIRTTPSLNSKYRISFDQQVWRKNDPSGKALVLGKVEMVCLDRDNKLVEIPQQVQDELQSKFGMKV